MGILSFLSRKTSSDNGGNLKAQPYNATTASLPPLRGAYPVAGNGPNILETLHKPQSQSSKNPDPVEFTAPAPIVPRFQNYDEYDRPQSAQSHDKKSWSSRSRSGSTKAPPVSLLNGKAAVKPRVELMDPPSKRAPYNKTSMREPERTDSPKPPYRLPNKGPGLQDSPMMKQPLKFSHAELDQTVFTSPQPAFAHNRTASIRSGDSAMSHRFVDILDASAAIKPSDFYSRLRATGARDYGEDVADRNIVESASNVDSPSTLAFYAQTASAPSPVISRGTPDPDGDFESRAKRRLSLGASLRTKSLISNSSSQYPARTTSHVPQQPPTPTDNVSRKSSTKSKASTVIEQRRKSLPSPVLEYEIEQFPAELQTKRQGQVKPSEDYATVLPMKVISSNRQSSPKRARDSVMLAKNKSAEGSRLVHVENVAPSSPGRKSSRRGTISYNPKAASTKSRRRMSIQGAQLASASQEVSGEEVRRGRSHTLKTTRDDLRGDLGSTTNPQDCLSTTTSQLDALCLPCVVYQRSGSSRGRPVLEQYSRPHSTLPFPVQSNRRLDFEDSVAERSSGTRKWSIDSSATISSLSSNPFRPQSRHTANTSVDFVTDNKTSQSSHDSLESVSYRTAPESGAPSALLAAEPCHTSKLRRDFNIDDYISSDDDDLDSPRRPLGVGEEDLLFQDTGYGFGGMELPGIAGLFDACSPRPQPPLSPPRSSSRASSPRDHVEYGRKGRWLREPRLNDRSLSPLSDIGDSIRPRIPSRSPDSSRLHAERRLSRFTMPEYELGDSEMDDGGISEQHEVEESDDELSLDIPMTRRGVVRHWNRPGRYQSNRQDIIEEEREDKIDISTAIRLRKETKRRNRLSGVPVVRRGEKGKEKDIVRPQTALDDRHIQGPMLTWDGRAFSLTRLDMP